MIETGNRLAALRLLRAASGAPIAACASAFDRAGGALTAAHAFMRQKGLMTLQAPRDSVKGFIGMARREDHEGTVAVAVALKVAGQLDWGASQVIALGDGLASLALDASLATVEELLGAPWAGGRKVREVLAIESASLGSIITLERIEVLGADSMSTVGSYRHHTRRLASFVLLSRTSQEVDVSGAYCAQLAHDLAIHVAALAPIVLARGELPAGFLAPELERFRAELEGDGKPTRLHAELLDAKLERVLRDVCLVDQPFVKNSQWTVGEVVSRAARRLRAPLRLEKFVRIDLRGGA